MNKRIDKLIDDARLTAVAEMFEVELTKFAELIVKECANHCDLLLDHKISSEWSRGTHDCSRAIKKHFGVKE
jgi:hypothetical protein